MIVPTLIHYDLLQRMLDSVDYPLGHLIVIDNGGHCPNLTSPADRTSILRMPSNLGVPSSWNLGIKLEPSAPYWVIASDDIIYEPGKLAQIPDLITDAFVCDCAHELRFASFALSDTVVEQVGIFDEYFWPGVGEDVQYHARMRQHQIPRRCLPHLYTHDVGATCNSLADSYDWKRDNIEQVTSQVRGYDLARRRYMETTYLKAGPPIQPTSE